ncbi:hypothetical protein N692_11360 [Lactiplantibacillus plantarum EGD-AQ4]|nr:hypothetical protein N692_11360 [Lactiplantibacillus plantarum EGD-AQ4]
MAQQTVPELNSLIHKNRICHKCDKRLHISKESGYIRNYFQIMIAFSQANLQICYRFSGQSDSPFSHFKQWKIKLPL